MRSRWIWLPVAGLVLSTTANADALDWANGYWGVSPKDLTSEEYKDRNCEDRPVSINIDRENNIYWSQIGDDTPRSAAISDITRTSFTLNYVNETRTMDDGRLHIWTIQFSNADSFYWIREDWKSDDTARGTVMRYRCEIKIS
ncbi:MAG: hypothetical protein HKN36_01380 [Hellea sp.]|nr:hypothetical protein [Hellea sp.]